MAITYTDAPQDVLDRLQTQVQRNHPDLVEAGVTFLVQVAHSSTGKPAVTFQGYPAAAVVKIVKLEDRSEPLSLPDVRIRIDGEYTTWSDATLDSTLDHECLHLIVLRDKEGQIGRDDVGRPKLKMRKHDHQIGIFSAIIERHGDAAFDAQLLRLAGMECKWLWEDMAQPARKVS